jgi:hypothetical protein
MNFLKEGNDLRVKALTYIRKVLDERGNDYQLIAPDDVDEMLDSGNIFEGENITVPTQGNSNDGYYTEYAILSIDVHGAFLIFNSISIEDREDKAFSEFDLDLITVLAIADLVYKLEN